jgi:hypothetical protein
MRWVVVAAGVLFVCVELGPKLSVRLRPGAGVDPAPPNAAGQTPAFPGQTRAPGRKSGVAFQVVSVAHDVRQGPDGALYVPTDSSAGRILKLVPK